MRLSFLFLCFSFLVSCSTSPKTRRHSYSHSRSTEGRYCIQLSKSDRLKILRHASPKNFPKTKYRKGPSLRLGIERETDCSRFVHEIYRRSGLPYSFKSTEDLTDAPEFDLIDEDDAKAGDLMLFRGHVGIVDENGLIISATKVRHKGQSSITRMNRDNFPGWRGRHKVLRYRCHPGMRLQADTP